MMTIVIKSDCVMYLFVLNMQSNWFFLVLRTYRHAVAEKVHGTVVKFDTCQNLERHRTVLPVIAQHRV